MNLYAAQIEEQAKRDLAARRRSAREARFLNEILGALVVRAIRAVREPLDRAAIIRNLESEYPEALADLDKTDREKLDRGL